MLTRGLGYFTTALWLFCCLTQTHASPISYAFTGTLNQPYNGSSALSGTITYDTSLPAIPCQDPRWGYYGAYLPGGRLATSMNFNLGGVSSSTLFGPDATEIIINHDQNQDVFGVQSYFNLGGTMLTADFTLTNTNLGSPGPFSSTALPSTLNLADFNLGGTFDFFGTTPTGRNIDVFGTITSLTQIPPIPLPVPEPSSVLIFAVAAFQVCRVMRSRNGVLPGSAGQH